MPLLFLDNWFNNAFIQALGWTLFHSLWQGFLLVVLVSLAIVLTKRSTATIRYRIFSSLFFIFIGTTLCTFIIEFNSLRSIPTPSLLTGNEIGDTLTLSTNTHTAAVDLKVPLPGRLAFYFNEYGPWLMLLWFIVFMLKSIRLGINYAQVQRIRNEKPYVLPAIEKRVNELAKLLRIRRKVILRETTSITVPVTIGFLKPLILIPCGLINNLPTDQVEAILLHELAHIRRMDYLVNLLQCLAETVFFFNPAVLWLSSLLREERENCCDDIAITVTQNKSLFIHALVAFQEYHAGHPMAPGLQGNKYPLLKRIQRIVYNNNKKLNHMEKIFLAAGLVVTGIVALAFTTPASDKTKNPATDAGSITQIIQPTYTLVKDSVPEHKILNGSINSTIDGKKYKVIVENDKPVGLYIDEKRVPDNELEEHHQIMEKIMEEGRDNFFKARKQDQQAKIMMDLYEGQSRQSQKRSEEALLQEKLFREQLQGKQLTDLETKADFDKKMELFRDEKKGNELFNQQNKMEQQDKFLKELQDDKFLTDLRKDKNMEELLLKGDRDNTYRLLLRDKLKKGEDGESVMKELTQQLEKQSKDNNKNKSEAERQLFLQRDQMAFEKILQQYQDTSKPKRRIDGKEIKDEADEAKMREMAEYRAMLEKEREKDRKEMEKEREKYKKEFEEKRKEMDKERDKYRKEMEEKRKEMQNEREKNRKEMDEEGQEKMKEMQKHREKERKEMEKERGEKMNEMQREQEKNRKEMQEEGQEKRKEMEKHREKEMKEMQEKGQEKRKEMQKEREKDRREMEEERRKEEGEERKKEDTERKKKTRDDNEKGEDGVYKGKTEFNYNSNKSTTSNANSKQEMIYDNKNGNGKFDYKLEYKQDRKDIKYGQDERRKESNQRRNELMNELKDDGIIPKDASGYSISMNDNEMIVNGVKQPQNIFNKYREKMRKNGPSGPKPLSPPVIKVSSPMFKLPAIAIKPLKVV